MGGRGQLSGQQTRDGVCQGPGDRAVSLPAPCSVTTLAQRGKVYRVTRQSTVRGHRSPHEGTAMLHDADAWPPCMQEKTANRGLPGEADGVAVSQKGRMVQTQQGLYFRRKVSAPTGSIEFVRQDDAGLHLPGHCDITGP